MQPAATCTNEKYLRRYLLQRRQLNQIWWRTRIIVRRFQIPQSWFPRAGSSSGRRNASDDTEHAQKAEIETFHHQRKNLWVLLWLWCLRWGWGQGNARDEKGRAVDTKGKWWQQQETMKGASNEGELTKTVAKFESWVLASTSCSSLLTVMR